MGFPCISCHMETQSNEIFLLYTHARRTLSQIFGRLIHTARGAIAVGYTSVDDDNTLNGAILRHR